MKFGNIPQPHGSQISETKGLSGVYTRSCVRTRETPKSSVCFMLFAHFHSVPSQEFTLASTRALGYQRPGQTAMFR